MIRVLDAYGRELFITKQAWRDSVLLGHLKKVWDDPEALYSAIVQGLQDGFGADMVEPAEHLASIDPNMERGTVVLANVYREQNRPQDSEQVLRRYIENHGESGLILTNLAKVQPDNAEQLQTIWRGLELDPNQENALGWYEVIHREKAGPAAGLEALHQIAALPGSWRARLWLARASLEARELPAALQLYREAMALAGQPTPADLLMQMSGDLGKAGHLAELLDLSLPPFDLTVHGLQVGNNLIKAYVDLGQFELARELVQQLYRQNRPDWKPTLSFWDTEIARVQAAATTVGPNQPLSVSMLNLEAPVWLPEQSPAHELFPKPTNESCRIAFLGSTGEKETKNDAIVHQLADGPGRLSRALPLFLAEQARFGTGVHAHVLQPWITAPQLGFMLMGMPWSDEEAIGQARQCEPACSHVVITHLKTSVEPWVVEWRLVRTEDGKRLASSQVTFPSNQSYTGMLQLTKDLLLALGQHVGVALLFMPAPYQVPTGTDQAAYLVRLEQLLAVRCSSLDDTHANFLSGERDILDGNLQLCLNQPKNPTTRILLFQTCLSMKRLRPEIAAEYRQKLEMLQREHPISRAAHEVLDQLLASVAAS